MSRRHSYRNRLFAEHIHLVLRTCSQFAEHIHLVLRTCSQFAEHIHLVLRSCSRRVTVFHVLFYKRVDVLCTDTSAIFISRQWYKYLFWRPICTPPVAYMPLLAANLTYIPPVAYLPLLAANLTYIPPVAYMPFLAAYLYHITATPVAVSYIRHLGT